jgi:hypothetical protein
MSGRKPSANYPRDADTHRTNCGFASEHVGKACVRLVVFLPRIHATALIRLQFGSYLESTQDAECVLRHNRKRMRVYGWHISNRAPRLAR